MKSDSIRPNFRNKGRRKRITPKKFFVSLLLYCYCCAHGVRCSETIGRHLPVHCIRIIRTLFGADLVFFPPFGFSLLLSFAALLPRHDTECGSGEDAGGAHAVAFECMNPTLFWPNNQPDIGPTLINSLFCLLFRTFNSLNGLFAYENVMILHALPFECLRLNDKATEAHCSLNRSDFNFSILSYIFFVSFIFTSHEIICHICHCDVENHPAVPMHRMKLKH